MGTDAWLWTLPALVSAAWVLLWITRRRVGWRFYAGAGVLALLCILAGTLAPAGDLPSGCGSGGGLECFSPGPGFVIVVNGTLALAGVAVLAGSQLTARLLRRLIDPHPD